jgi:tetratricopeptide (TPR) repeat protein
VGTKNEDIDFAQIQDYFNGKLTPKQKHALELRAENDPFLYEAMEGYQAHPEGINRLARLKKNQAIKSRSFFGSGTLSIIGIATFVYIVALLLKPNVNEDISLNNNPSSFQEVEIIPASIDSFVLADIAEQITPEEILKSKPLLEEFNEKFVEHLVDNDPEVINIDEDVKIEDDNTILAENEFSVKYLQAPHIYHYDLYVVDYREIKRENVSINYTRYEFSGLSAEFEDENSEDRKYDRESEVEVPYMEYLKTSMKYFSRGQYKRALTRYLTILEQYPEDLNAHFYGALCYFDMKQYEKALLMFEETQRLEEGDGYIAFRQEAKWYQGKTLISLNRAKEAKNILDQIISEGLFYAKEAIVLKAKL